MSGLNAVPQNIDPALRDLLEQIKERIETWGGHRNGGVGALVSVEALANGQVPGVGPINGGGGGDGGGIDLTPPPTPTGLAAFAGVTRVVVEIDQGAYSQGRGHDRTVIYGAIYTGGPLPTFDDAVSLGDFLGTVGQFETDPATTWRLWAKWRSLDGVESASPAGGTNGVAVTTGPVNNQQIGNLAVDNAKIANVSAAKLTVGDGTVGGNLKSSNYNGVNLGWIVRPDGYSEFNTIVARGTVYASAGAIGGATILSDRVQSSNFIAGVQGWRWLNSGALEANSVTLRGKLMGGSFSAWAWPPAGQTGFYLGVEGLLLGNYNDNRYFQVTAAGDVYAPNFSIVAGKPKFAAGATDAVDTVNVVNGAVTRMATVAGSGAISTNIVVPSGLPMDIFALCVTVGGATTGDEDGFGGIPVGNTLTVTINGSSKVGYTPWSYRGFGPSWEIGTTVAAHLVNVVGPATVAVSASDSRGFSKTLIAIGRLR